MRTPRYDSTRRRDRLHLWALRTYRRGIRLLPGVAALQDADRRRRLVYLQVSTWRDGDFQSGDVQTYAMDADSFAVHQRVDAYLPNGDPVSALYSHLIRIFSDDPRRVGYRPGTRPDEAPEYNWPSGPPEITERQQYLATLHRRQLRKRATPPITDAPPNPYV